MAMLEGETRPSGDIPAIGANESDHAHGAEHAV
jgi:hypothetical protein